MQLCVEPVDTSAGDALLAAEWHTSQQPHGDATGNLLFQKFDRLIRYAIHGLALSVAGRLSVKHCKQLFRFVTQFRWQKTLSTLRLNVSHIATIKKSEHKLTLLQNSVVYTAFYIIWQIFTDNTIFRYCILVDYELPTNNGWP